MTSVVFVFLEIYLTFLQKTQKTICSFPAFDWPCVLLDFEAFYF